MSRNAVPSLEKQLQKDLKRVRDENLQALPGWAQAAPVQPKKSAAKKPKKRKKK